MTRISADAVCEARSLLFVPGDRPDRFAKAIAAQPDIVIIDLEDAVADGDKDRARANARAWLCDGNDAMVRINGLGTLWHKADLELVDEFGPPVMLPKAERSEDVSVLEQLHGGSVTVVPLIETARGIMAAASLCASSSVARCAFGSIDFAAEVRVDAGDREALLIARTMLVLASAAAGCAPPIDGVTTTIDSLQPTADDFQYVRRLGMTAKLCIHPRQVSIVHREAALRHDTLAWARRVLQAAATSPTGAVAVDGQMVDKPILDRARTLVAEAARQAAD